jgi:peptidoglycan-N-acetylglucosamine deacetylase
MKINAKAITSLVLTILVIGASSLYYSKAWNRSFFLKPLHKLETNEKLIALTFDDGPSQKRTLPLLALLKKYNTKANFFMLGKKIESYPDIAMQVYEEGHLIGNHSYDHSRLMFKTPAFIDFQIVKTDSLIRALGQSRTLYFRPPYSSKFIFLPYILKQKNKILVTGTFDPPAEYKKPFLAEIVAKEVLNNVKPGSIIYLHDGKDQYPAEFVRAVELIILGLQSKGYKFVRLDKAN